MEIRFRDETADDVAAIQALHEQAFGQPEEARIVAALRRNHGVILSLVATWNGQVVGHILYSPIAVAGEFEGAALGPMAVLPQFQKQGIGSRLVRLGNERLEQAGVPFVIVLGHAGYYPRFGFRPASEFGITCQWDVPDSVFMLLVLDEHRMASVSGEAQYRSEFSVVD